MPCGGRAGGGPRTCAAAPPNPAVLQRLRHTWVPPRPPAPLPSRSPSEPRRFMTPAPYAGAPRPPASLPSRGALNPAVSRRLRRAPGLSRCPPASLPSRSRPHSGARRLPQLPDERLHGRRWPANPPAAGRYATEEWIHHMILC